MKSKFYLVMKMSRFQESLKCSNGQKLTFDRNSPQFFCPVFTNLRRAEEWAGDKSLIREIALK